MLTLERRDVPSAPFGELGDDMRLPQPYMIAPGPFPPAVIPPILMGGPGGGPAGPLQPPEVPFTYSTNGAGLPLVTGPATPVTIFLDFTGYDLDANAATYNATEQSRIVECWRQTSVYFAPFDVTVTTVQPNVQTTPTAWLLIANQIDNGYAYVGSFPSTQATGFTNSYFAFDRTSGVAHELGHMFGCWHQSDYDGLGNKTAEYSSGDSNLHVPIMGVDFAGYTRQWTLAHGSTTPETLQNDLAIIANRVKAYQPVGGDGYKADEHGNTTGSASPMTVNGANQCGWGVVERPDDVDAFSFTSAGGTYAVSAAPNFPSALDARFELYSSGGTLLAASDAASNDQVLTVNLPAGTYYVLVASHGDYGDIGAYFVHARPLPAAWETQNIGNVVGAGYAGYDSSTGAYGIGGGGADIWGTADSFRFTYTPISGNASITVRVDAQEYTNFHAKAGVMIRESLTAGARHVSAVVKPSNYMEMVYRTNNNFSAQAVSQVSIPGLPRWLRLTRTGNTFAGYQSADGVTWILHGSFNITMAATVYVGLAVSSTSNSQANPSSDAAFSNLTLIGNPPTPPAINGLPAPTNLTAVPGTGAAIDLSWNAVVGATSYLVERSPDNVRWTQATSTAATNHTELPGGSQRWFYRVAALDAAGRSLPSAVQSVINRPIAPAITRIMALRANTLVVDWQDVAGDTGYRVERSTDGGANWTTAGVVGTNVPSLTDTGLTAYTQYSYRVIPLSLIGDGPASPIVNRYTRLPALTGLAFTSASPTQLALQWNAVANATSYRVERSTDGGAFTIVSNSALTTYTDNSVVPLGEYYYRVTGVNAQTESEGRALIFRAAPATAALPAPWTTADIGAVGGVGAGEFSNNIFTLVGSGTDIWNSSDQFRFAFRPLTGNGTITARVMSQDNTAGWSKVGVMIRESTAANSRHAIMAVTPGNGVAFQWRSSTGGNSTNTNSPGVAAPYWVRIRRVGNTFTGFASPDGVTWTPVGSAVIAMSATVQVGLAACSGNNAQLTTARFDNVQLATGAPRVASLVVNNGAAQRSRVTSLQVNFNQSVVFAGPPVAAFDVRRQADNAPAGLIASVDDTGPNTMVTLTFGGALSTGGSLDDGRYTLTVAAGQVSNADGNLDGDGNGAGGDDFVLAGDLTNRLYRLFGDGDGDGDVDATDFGAFRMAFGAADLTYDGDNDGDVDAADFGSFRSRFGTSV